MKYYCKYNEARDSFTYCSEQKHPNIFMRFKVDRGNKDLSSILANGFKVSDQFVCGDGPAYIQEILFMLFSTP